MTAKINDTFFSNVDCFVNEKAEMIAIIQHLHYLQFDDLINLVQKLVCYEFACERFIART